jgi:transcriptional regulator with XRE-family HTH domain
MSSASILQVAARGKIATHVALATRRYDARMKTKKLPHYLGMYRKRSGLSQDELGYLLGSNDGSKICRYEKRHRFPSLDTSFAYGVVFGIGPGELFAGRYEHVETNVLERIQSMYTKFQAHPRTPLTKKKMAFLADALARHSNRYPQ